MAGTRDRGDPPRRDEGLTPAPDNRIAAAQDSLAAAFREESSRLTASVTRILGGDFAAAEEVVQDALLAAWRQWPAGGVPDQPAAWLRTVARRRAIDVLRRDLRYRTGSRQRLSLPVPPPASPPAPPLALWPAQAATKKTTASCSSSPAATRRLPLRRRWH